MANVGMTLAQQMRQKQIMAPQMRQSLEVLQLQVQDLCMLAQQELERNPALEEVVVPKTSIDEERERYDSDGAGHDEAVHAEYVKGAEEDDGPHEAREEPDYGRGTAEPMDAEDGQDGGEPEPIRDFEVLSQIDDYGYLYQDGGNNEYNPDLEERRQFMFDSMTAVETLQEHLLNQLDMAELGEVEVLVAEQIIGSITDDGYLRTPLADIAQVVIGADLEMCERVLAAVQEFDPPGVGARDLRECMLLQIRGTPMQGTLAERVIRDHADLLALNQIGKIAEECGVERGDVEEAIRQLARLEPRPGAKFGDSEPAYIVPEVEVRKVDGVYKAFVQDANIPQLRIAGKYAELANSPETPPETREYIQGKIRSGMNLIKSIEQRQETIRNVAQEIVDMQQEFFDKGVSALKPMVMADIAEKVGVHETTISRTVSNKYMISPQGIHELKYFFTTGIPTESGVDVSSEHVKELIKRMVDAEDPRKPLADQDIERKLAEDGINIARRTIAKYRGLLNIPASHLRRLQ